jgi:hypothetical protein
MTEYSLAIVVMAHPSRRARAEMLAEYVEADVIVWDENHDGEVENGDRAWARGASYTGISHVLVLQDDAMPVADLRRHVLARIAAEPHSPLSLYLGRKKPTRWAPAVADAVEEAEAVGACWIASTHLLHGVGLVLPVHMARAMLIACEVSPLPYDQRIGRYLRVTKRPVLYTWPSLVDHDDDTPSLVTHVDDHKTGTTGRIAYRVGTVDAVTATVVMVETPRGAEA